MACIRHLAALSASLSAALACAGSSPTDAPPAVVAQPATAARARSAPSRPASYDAREATSSSSAPAFEWRTSGALLQAAVGEAAPREPVAAARAHLGLGAGPGGPAAVRATGPAALDEAVVSGIHDLGRGPVIVQFQRRVAGLDVFGEKTAVVMTRALRLVARSGSVPAPARAAPAREPFALTDHAAIAAALTDLTGEVYAAGDLVAVTSRADAGLSSLATLADATAAVRRDRLVAPARARKVLFPLGEELLPAYQVELALRRPDRTLLGYAYVISAVDGTLLFRCDQVRSEAFTYGVWATPGTAAVDPFLPDDGPAGIAGTPYPAATMGYQPAPIAERAVTLQSYPFSRGDPWLASGATETHGNNADAYVDLGGQQGLDGADFRATATSARTFSYPYDFGAEPDATRAQISAAITQLFYDVNFFHDWYYDAGFDEASGNAQVDDYGRGGKGGDPLLAEAQDFAGLDNAQMYTPGDGSSPRMQMYLWSGNGPRYVEVTAPAAITGKIAAAVADFGPDAFDLTGSVVAAAPAVGCPALTNKGALRGKIVLMDRGPVKATPACTFKLKARLAQDAGALGVIVRNVAGGTQSFGGMADDPAVTTAITIPIELVQQADGERLAAQLGAGITARLYRPHLQLRDGTLDNLVVAHEWGHFISGRLIGDGAGLATNQAGGLGEGWGDTHALLLAVREADVDVPGNAAWNGAYGLSGWVAGGQDAVGLPNDGYYFGIRRVPYSTDMEKDPLTFRHIAEGVRLVPVGSTIPIAFGADGAGNSEVHDTGEVWATMLWECYAALLRDTQGASPRRTFDQARDQWKAYLVAAYKLTPLDPTLLEARDALLAVAYASDHRDYQLFWQAFAKRGAGAGATGPARSSKDNNPVVESYLVSLLTPVSATFEASPSSCTDGDGTLDSGETGTLHLSLRNDGETPLPAGTASVSASVAALTMATPAVAIPASEPGATVAVDVEVALSPAAAPTAANLVLTYGADSALSGEAVVVTLTLDRDEVAGVVQADAGKCAQKSGGGGCSSAPGAVNPSALLLSLWAAAALLRRRAWRRR